MPTGTNRFLKRVVRSSVNMLGYQISRHAPDERELEDDFIAGGRRPWSVGYDQAKQRFIQKTLANPELLELFAAGGQLPPGYGVGLDERCIEYPWLISNLSSKPDRMLDAGSALNHGYLLEHPAIGASQLHILTLAPEPFCFWNRTISYLFEDLRDIPIRSNFYDVIACISTLEHVGCDNSFYMQSPEDDEHDPLAFTLAMRELRRVLKPAGSLLFTVPFGAYQHLGFSQQFNASLLQAAIEAFGEALETQTVFYRYGATGWQIASAEACAKCEYVDWSAAVWQGTLAPEAVPTEPDLAAAARAVACVKLAKA